MEKITPVTGKEMKKLSWEITKWSLGILYDELRKGNVSSKLQAFWGLRNSSGIYMQALKPMQFEKEDCVKIGLYVPRSKISSINKNNR